MAIRWHSSISALTLNHPEDEDILYLQIKPTDENGKVDFKELDPGEYYWQVQFEEGGDYVDLGMGSIEVIAGGKHGMPVFINGSSSCQ